MNEDKAGHVEDHTERLQELTALALTGGGGVTLAAYREGRYWPMHPSYAHRVRGMLQDAGMPHDHIVDEEVGCE